MCDTECTNKIYKKNEQMQMKKNEQMKYTKEKFSSKCDLYLIDWRNDKKKTFSEFQKLKIKKMGRHRF